MNDVSRCTRIIYVIDSLGVGGTERSLLQICKHLDRNRFEPFVISLYNSNDLLPEFQSLGIDVRTIDIHGKYRFLHAARAVCKVITETNADIIHGMLFRANQVARLSGWKTHKPIVSSLVNVPYDPIRLKYEPHLSYWKHRCIRLLDRISSIKTTRFHAVSMAVKESYCRTINLPADKISVIPRGRETARTNTLSASQLSNLKIRLDIPCNKKVLLNVGRLVPQKDHINLVRAMKYVSRHQQDSLLLIAGDGPMREQIENCILSNGLCNHVLLLGQINNVEDLLQLADCFVFPSVYEGLPGTVIEAMMAGCPVIASDIEMLKEMIEDGQTGLLVEQQNPRSLADGILKMLSDKKLAERCANQARQYATTRYNIESVVREMEQLYCNVIDEYGK